MVLLRFAFYAHFHTTSGVVGTAGKTTFHHSQKDNFQNGEGFETKVKSG